MPELSNRPQIEAWGVQTKFMNAGTNLSSQMFNFRFCLRFQTDVAPKPHSLVQMSNFFYCRSMKIDTLAKKSFSFIVLKIKTRDCASKRRNLERIKTTHAERFEKVGI